MTTPKTLLLLDTALSAPSHSSGRILLSHPPGSSPTEVLSSISTLPDGIALDRVSGHMYVTHMGSSLSSNSGFIARYNLDGSGGRVVVPAGREGVWTPKQITFVRDGRRGGEWVYWCDREGMRVCRARVDGEEEGEVEVEVLVQTGDPEGNRGECERWCVGVAVDVERGFLYWSQKGASKGNAGRIFRARIEDVRGTAEVVLRDLPEPIDLEIDEVGGWLYWTDRGDPPRGNTLNRVFVGDGGVGGVEVLARRLHEAIGLAVDAEAGKAYVSDLAGGVYEVDLETREKRVLFAELGDLTGIAVV